MPTLPAWQNREKDTRHQAIGQVPRTSRHRVLPGSGKGIGNYRKVLEKASSALCCGKGRRDCDNNL